MSEQSLEKAEHELDIRRADERDEHWQAIHRENLRTVLGIVERDRHARNFTREWAERMVKDAKDFFTAVHSEATVPERHVHVAKPIADVLNKFSQ